MPRTAYMRHDNKEARPYWIDQSACDAMFQHCCSCPLPIAHQQSATHERGPSIEQVVKCSDQGKAPFLIDRGEGEKLPCARNARRARHGANTSAAFLRPALVRKRDCFGVKWIASTSARLQLQGWH